MGNSDKSPIPHPTQSLAPAKNRTRYDGDRLDDTSSAQAVERVWHWRLGNGANSANMIIVKADEPMSTTSLLDRESRSA